MGLVRVTADADYYCSQSDEILVCIAERAGLGCADRGVVLWIEEHDDWLLSLKVRQRNGFSVRCGGRKIGSCITDFD